MNPAPHGRHARLDITVRRVLDPLAERHGLFLYGIINVGEPDDFRIPDLAVLTEELLLDWYPTAALVVEILSPHDETWKKLGFYAAHGVAELVVVDPFARRVVWMRSDGTTFFEVDRSELLDIDVAEFAAQIDWPPVS